MDTADPNTCKLLFSGMANGYPSPIIINWGNERDRPYGGVDRSHVWRVIKGLEYLDVMMRDTAHPDDRVRDDDLIVFLDAIDLWWQLPPEVLIRRYHEINREANKRFARKWGKPGRMPMEQSIVFAGQKRCWPGPKQGIDMLCDALPESPEREDLYGPETDKGNKFKHRVYTINGGTYMGRAADVKRFLRRVKDRLSRVQSHHPEVMTDQGLFGEVWGEQEVVRTWLREQPNRGDEAWTNSHGLSLMRENMEYSIGLDYGQQLVSALNFKQHDGELLKLGDRAHLDQVAAEHGIDPVRLTGVPADLENVPTPLHRFLPDEATPGWGGLTVFADWFAASVPAIVHFNGNSTRIVEWFDESWTKTWFYPYLRRLARRYLERPAALEPLGEYVFGGGEHRVTYMAMPSELTKRKPRRWAPDMAEAGLPVMEFDELCRHKPGEVPWYDQVFGDGTGPI